MSDAAAAGHAASPERGTSAGALLRHARQAQGLHIAALASAIKVVPKKLEALEADRLEELPDATFARALAQAVCRFLKIDPAPVLALLPPLSGPRRLEQVAEGLNTPFHEASGRLVPREWARVTRPALWLALLIVLATLAVYLFPTHWRPLFDAATGRVSSRAPAVRAGSAAAGALSPSTLAAMGSAGEPGSVTLSGPTIGVDAASLAPAAGGSGAAEAARASAALMMPPAAVGATPAAAAASAAGAGWLRIETGAPSWVGVTDGHSRMLLARTLQADERVALDGDPPLRVTIGNAFATRLTVRGVPLDIAPSTTGNIARLDVK